MNQVIRCVLDSLLQLKKGLKQGTVYKAKVFAPSLQAAVDADVVVGPTENIDLFGKVVPLTKVEVTMQTPAGAISSTSYVDKQMHYGRKHILEHFLLAKCH